MLNSGVFFRVLKDGENHLKYIREFVDTYNLPYSFTDDDSNEAPALLAKDGYLVVKTSWDYMNIVIFYVPWLITTNQKKWLDTNLDNFKNYEYLGFNNYSVVDGEVKEEKIEDFDIELSEINKRYLNYRKSSGIKGRVVIIPDEEQVLMDEFEQDILDDEYHVKAYQKFVDENNMGIEFGEDESHIASLSIAELGHFNYKTEDDIGVIAFYLPSKVTDRQLEYFENHKDDYASYGTVGAYIFRRVDDTIYTDEIYGLDVIENQMIKRNRKSEEKGHVR